MNPPTAELRSLAEQLVEYETGPQPGVRQMVLGAEVVCRKLAGGLEPLVGSTGFEALLTRALHLASFESPLLESVRSGTASTGWLEGLNEPTKARDIEEVRDAIVAALACSLRLLGHFIGDDLAVRIVYRAWPGVPPARARAAFQNSAPRGDRERPGERRTMLRAATTPISAEEAPVKASDVMTRNLEFVTRDDPLTRAAQIMRDRDVGCVPVLENGGSGRLEGLITDRDIATRHVADDHGNECIVQHHMSANGIQTVTPDDDVNEVLEAMNHNQDRHVPVVEDGNRLVGIIARADVTREGLRDEDASDVVEGISESSSRPQLLHACQARTKPVARTPTTSGGVPGA